MPRKFTDAGKSLVAWLDLFRGGRKATSLDLFREIYGTPWSTKAGRSVTLENAIRISAVFSCARLLGNGVAQVPLKLMRQADRMRAPAVDHPLYQIMGRRPNPWQTSFEFRQVMSWHVELFGRFVAVKIAPAGRLRELIPLEPASVTITRRDDMTLKYVVRAPNGTEREIPEESIWHVRGPSWDSWSGINPVMAAREAIGLAISIEESQAGLHSQGVRASGVYSVEGKLSPEQHKDLRAWLLQEYGAAANAGKPMVLDRSAKWMQTQMSGIDAQVLETRQQQIAEVCRFMGVLPIMVGVSDKATTYASAEQMFLAHLIHTLSPRWTAYEQSMDVNLLTEKEMADGYYFDFVEEGMIRGSVKDTKDAILGYVNGGILTPNEGRALLDRNPDPDPLNDKLRIPVNVAQEGGEKPPREDPAP
jgi:HK97 family phage portal protein